MIIYTNDEVEYAETRLVDTVVLCNSIPVKILGFLHSKTPQVVVSDIRTSIETSVPMSSIDLSPIPLGYINYKGRLNYVARVPVRGDYRQGLRYSNMTSICGIDVREIPWQVICNTITNQYPTIDNVVAFMQKKGPQAWHRDWGIENNFDLIYKGLEVAGSVDVNKGNLLSLHSDYEFLQESLVEAIEEARSNHHVR